jgi:hypothetical protein
MSQHSFLGISHHKETNEPTLWSGVIIVRDNEINGYCESMFRGKPYFSVIIGNSQRIVKTNFDEKGQLNNCVAYRLSLDKNRSIVAGAGHTDDRLN